jgi:lipopolysaccharide export system protein LptA
MERSERPFIALFLSRELEDGMLVLKRALLFFFLGFLLTGSGVWGAAGAQGKNKDASEPERPIVTTADTLELDNKNKTATFTGNVVAKQEQKGKDPLIIYCDKMVIYSSGEAGKKPSTAQNKGNEKKSLKEQNQVDKIVATGQVKIHNGKDRATGETAVFYHADQRIILSGKAEFWQGKNLVKGEEITVWIKEDRALVTSKGSDRVRAVIYQEEK